MSRPIAYNASGPLSGSIRGGNVNYTVDSGNRDYTTFASKKWVPSTDGVAPIVFVTDTYTQGFELNPNLAVPLFYSCNGTGSAAILYTANRIPNSPGNYSDANVALNDLISARGYFILESNDPYQGDYQSGDLLMLDASKMSSYPQTGTNFYDLSGNGFSFSLVNGPTFNSNGWFGVDGTDDSIYLSGNGTLKSTNTLVMWMRTTDVVGLFLSGQPPYTGGGYYVGAYYPGQGFYNANAGSPDFFLDTLATSNPATPINYLDGRFHMWEAKGLNFATWTTNWNFVGYDGSFAIAGDVAKIKMFDSYLTAAQSKQLYFGAPIVTDGLVFAVDANNIVSYPKSGTSTYNLTGSGVTGTLTNGTSFNISNGGSFMFDGTNDYISFPNDTNLDSQAITMESWSKINVQFQNAFLFEKGQVNSQYSNFYNGDGTFYFRTMGLSNQDLTFYYPSYISPNTWNHIVCTYGAGIKTIYVNGIQVSQQTGLTGTIPTDTTGLFIGAYGPGSSYFLNGKIANSRVYNRALTAAEVLQNYQAEQYRFETYPSIPTNGLILHLDASNLQSYPGSGTVWYDISGQGANADLVNGVTWNPSGYFFFDGADDIANSINISQDYRDLVIGIWSESNGGLEMVFSLYGGFDASFRLNANVMFSANNNDDWQFGSNDLVFVDGAYTPQSNLGSQFHFVRTYRSNNVDFGTSFRYSLSSTFLSRYFKGKIAFVLCYNRQLSDAEVRGLYYYYKDRFPF